MAHFCAITTTVEGLELFYWANDMKAETIKLVCGVAVNDADYVTRKNEVIGYVDGKQKLKQVWACPYYQTWTNMLRRCYSAKWQERYPSYKGCTVSADWLVFSKFKAWMEKQEWEGKQLDKDLLFEGNKIYSASTCVFVSQTVNKFANDHGASRGEWKIGVNWHKRDCKFQAKCCNPFTKKKEFLGYFDCEQAAHQAWAKRKLELAHELAVIQTDARVAKALIDRYSKYKMIEQ